MSAKSKRPQDWTTEERFQAMIETASLSPEEKSAWCRTKGLHTQQLDQWRQDFLTGASASAQPKRTLKESRLNKKVRALEKDLQRKEKALAEASALLLFKKKWTKSGGVKRTTDHSRRKSGNPQPDSRRCRTRGTQIKR